MDIAAKVAEEPYSTDAALCINDSYRCLEMLSDQAVKRSPFMMVLYLSPETPATAMRSQLWQSGRLTECP
ncbi:MAG: hypothetical protein ACI84R_004108 [Candidatus Azotimanducaceae bacterium]|jgi:hypothetical protein